MRYRCSNKVIHRSNIEKMNGWLLPTYITLWQSLCQSHICLSILQFAIFFMIFYKYIFILFLFLFIIYLFLAEKAPKYKFKNKTSKEISIKVEANKAKWRIWALCEKYPNAEFFLVRIFLYLVRIQENTDQIKFRLWALFTQWEKNKDTLKKCPLRWRSMFTNYEI